MTDCDVAVIGAGPYGLSIGAHLKARGVNFCIFGNPMDTWLTHMPKGMRLKSEGFASSLYDPGSTFTLETYCQEKGLPYSKIGLPVPLEVFSAYGLEFQRRFVPELEKKVVEGLEQTTEGFQLRVQGGRTVLARRVVMAIGLTHYRYVPPVLAALPEEFLTHSSKHNRVDDFKGREVIVVGAGASAIDLTALLYQAGAHVQVVARKPVIRFHDPPGNLNPSFIDQLRSPITGIGPGWKLFLCSNAPLLFRKMPEAFRLDRVRKILGPAPCWFTKAEVVGKLPLHVNSEITEASVENGRPTLQIRDSTGSTRKISADHIIAATGYRVDLDRLAFVNSELRSQIRSVENTPILSSNFESSLPGLYFVGVSAANTFGPLLRFAFGAGFTAKRLSKHLAKSSVRQGAPKVPKLASEEAVDREIVAH